MDAVRPLTFPVHSLYPLQFLSVNALSLLLNLIDRQISVPTGLMRAPWMLGGWRKSRRPRRAAWALVQKMCRRGRVFKRSWAEDVEGHDGWTVRSGEDEVLIRRKKPCPICRDLRKLEW